MKKILSAFFAVVLVSAAIHATIASAAFSDVSDSYKTEVEYIVSSGYAKGVSATKFGTDQPIKRIDAAVMVARALGFNENSNIASAGFTDVPADRAWAVNALAARGVISGKKPGTYGSNENMTRSEMAKVIASAYDLSNSTNSIPFTDVSPRFVPFVAALSENGITQGKTSTLYGGNDTIKRGEFAIFIYRADHLSKIDPPEVEDVY